MRYICSECGSEIPEGEDFCSRCGALKSKAIVTDDNGNFNANVCPNCGAPTVPGENFCGSCGAAIANPSVVQMKPVKNAWLALGLALIPGFFNVYGLGHLVLRKWSRGIMFLAISAILFFARPAINPMLGVILDVGVFMFQAFDIMKYVYSPEGA